MGNRTRSASVAALALVAPGPGIIRTCPTSKDGATAQVEGNVRKRTSVDVVWRGSGAGNVSPPTRCRAGDGGGHLFVH